MLTLRSETLSEQIESDGLIEAKTEALPGGLSQAQLIHVQMFPVKRGSLAGFRLG
jgi:hypothetical protein